MTTKPRARSTRKTTTPDLALATTTTTETVPTPVPTLDLAARIDATFPGNASPTLGFVRAMAHAFTLVAPLPVGTVDERRAVRSAIVAALHDAYPGTTNTGVRNSGMFSGLHVFESQNAIYLAAALSGVYVTDGHFVAAWSADLPNARCNYLERVGYPTSTLSEYLGGRHNQVPGVDGARDVIYAWMTAKRNKPAAK